MSLHAPLHGLRVLDLTRLLPGGIASMMLADLGAEIIKVEDPQGGDYARYYAPMHDGQSVFFRMNNRGKRSVILDLKQAAGVDALKRLAASADVLIESFRPGTMQRLGVDYDALKAVNPRLVMASMSGWGAQGPNASLSGHDLNFAAAAGLVGAMETPQPLGGQIADVAGAYATVAAINAALFHRERTGEGAYVDIGLAEAALPFALYNWVEALYAGPRTLLGGQACYRVYTAADGQPVALAALEPKFWRRFCEAVQRPDLIDDYDAPARQPYLTRVLSALFATRPAADWERLLVPADCCFSRVTPLESLHEVPHFQARGLLGVHADGVPWMRSPLRLSSEAAADISAQSPAYGQDTRAVLAGVGYTADELDALDAAGVTRPADAD